jgi:tetratricopeptide (TPR) repeat protein
LKLAGTAGLLVILVPLLLVLNVYIGNNYLYPFPPVSNLKDVGNDPYLELGGLFMGVRSLAADVVWIQTLQYYGGPSDGEEQEKEEAEHEGHHHHDLHDMESTAYTQLLPLCERAVWLDPYFLHVYVLGSAAIGFVQERYDEASQLLKEGVVWNYNPGNVRFWRMNYSLAAIGYAKVKDYKKVIDILEKTIEPNESPLILVRVLANTYEKNGEYRKSYQLWKIIEDRFPEEGRRAREKMNRLSLHIES